MSSMIRKYIIAGIADEHEMKMNNIIDSKKRGIFDSQEAQSQRIIALDTTLRKLLKEIEETCE